MSSKNMSNLPPVKEEGVAHVDDPYLETFNNQRFDLNRFNLPLNDPGDSSKLTRLQTQYIPESPDPDPLQKFAGIGLEIASVVIGSVVSHPCVVLRRQCQVNRKSTRYHLSPFTLIPVLIRLQNRQGFVCLWKGCSGIFILRGCSAALETFIAEITPFPREVSSRSSFKQLSQHLLLKIITYSVLTPFYCASLVETVQSDIASEKPGVLDCLKEGVCRLFKIGTPRSTRLFPMWQLIAPAAAHGISFYLISALVRCIVRWTVTVRQRDRKDSFGDTSNSSTTVCYLDNLSTIHFSSFIANLVLYPAETLMHRLYLQGTRTIIDNLDSGTSVFPVITEYEGFADGFHTIINEEGVAGLYKGLGGLIMEYTIQAFILKAAQVIFLEIERIMKPPIPKKPHL